MNNRWFKLVLILGSVLILSLGCNTKDAAELVTPDRVAPPKITPKSLTENVGRSTWQKPELVIQKLGNIEGLTVADIGAGTGYFVVRLAYKGAKVIAVDIDPSMLEFIQAFMANLPGSLKDNITTRLGMPMDAKLQKEEADHIIIINTASYIKNINQYLKHLYPSLKPNGKILIVEFKDKIIDIPAPPMSNRVSASEIFDALSSANYKEIEIDETSLDYQYIVVATK